MAQLLPSRRRAEEFARAVEGQVRHGEVPPVDASLQRLLDTASRLSAVPVVEPRAEFRDSLRHRLLEAAAVELRAGQEDPVATPGVEQATPVREGSIVDDVYAARRRRRLVAVATGLVLVGGGTGVAAASEQALPGDMLYPIKRTLEAAEVSLAQGADDEGRELLERAATRLDEAEALSTTSGSTPTETDLGGVAAALTDFAADASDGGQELLDAYRRSGDPADVRVLRGFTATSHEGIRDLADRLPPQSQPELLAADEIVVTLDDLAMQACPECTSSEPLLPLQLSAVSLPDLDADAAPQAVGGEPLAVRMIDQAHSGAKATDRRAPRQGARDRNDERDRDRRDDGPAPRPDGAAVEPAQGIPGVDLGGPAGKQPAPGGDATTAPVDGVEAPAKPNSPKVDDVGDAVEETVPRPPRTNDGSPADGGLTDTVDGLEETVDDVGDSLADVTGQLTQESKPAAPKLQSQTSRSEPTIRLRGPDTDVDGGL